MNIVVTRAPATLCSAACVTEAMAEQTENRKRGRFRGDVPDHAAVRFVVFAVKSVQSCYSTGFHGMGKAAVRFIGQLGDVAAASGRLKSGPCEKTCVCPCPVGTAIFVCVVAAGPG